MSMRPTLSAPFALIALLALGACGEKEAVDDSSVVTDDSGPPDRDGDGVPDDADCDPDDPYTYPGANDIPYDGKDNDCAGDGDLVDVDGDGYVGVNADGDDCNDSNPTVYPGAPEICYDNIDQDCAGDEDSYDCDGDGYDGRGEDATDCDDEDPDIHPDQPEIWYDGVDQDCSGFLESDYDMDKDGDDHDGYGGTDCDDEDPLTAGGNPELWDGHDRNCDSVVDNLDIGASIGSWYGDKGVNDGLVGLSGAIFEDYDGDGYATIAMSGVGSADGEYDGAVYMVDVGDADGSPAKVAVTDIHGEAGYYLGMDMANVGDLNGDGLSELLVGSVLFQNGTGIVFDGQTLSTGGALTVNDRMAYFTGNTYLGIDVTGVGDVNGDGVPDVAGGTGWYLPTHVVVYSGVDIADGGAVKPVEALSQIDGDGSTGGLTVGGLDINADGFDDLLIGSFTTGSGITVPLSGVDASAGNLLDPNDLDWIRGSTGDQVGFTSGWLDDVTNNGYPELLIRAYGKDGDETGAGVIYVIDGADVDFTVQEQYAADIAHYTINGSFYGGRLHTPERGGDFDGDGVEDLPLVHAGDRNLVVPWIMEGELGLRSTTYVHFSDKIIAGGVASANESDVTIGGNNDDDLTGYTTLAGDLDADGLDDLVFSAPSSSASAGSFWALISELDSAAE